MRLLYILDKLPFPPVSGDRIRNYSLLRRVARQHEVWIASLTSPADDPEALSHLKTFCSGVETSALRPGTPLSHLPGLMEYALRGRPLELKFRHSEELAGKIRDLARRVPFDITQIEHSYMALYREAIPAGARSKQVLEFHNVEGAQYDRIARLEPAGGAQLRTKLHSRMMQRWEPRYARRFDRCITVSGADRDLLLAADPRLAVDVVPNGVDTHAYRPLSAAPGAPALVFVGTMSYAPCADAMIHFSREILPSIREAVGSVELWIVGKDPPQDVLQLEGDGIHVTGRVPDVVPYYARSSVCVVPLRAGGGTRLKILESMALGRPVVTTSVGCEGLDVIDGEHLLVADSPEHFAGQTVRLLTDPTLYQRLAANARQLVAEKYDWDVIAEQLVGVYRDLAARELSGREIV